MAIIHCKQGLLCDKPLFISSLANAVSTVSSKVLSFGKELTLYQTTFRLFQTEKVCRRKFKFDENGRKFPKWVENTVGKGEIARYEQLVLFP